MNRREFLRAVGSLAASAAAGPYLPAAFEPLSAVAAAPVIIPPRHIYGRVEIPALVFASQTQLNFYRSMVEADGRYWP